jgi:hypothetical protein
MTNSDRKQFAQLCALMSQAFDKEMSVLLTDIYFDSLKDFTIGQVESAIRQAIKSRKFMPRVAELRELIEGNPADRGASAWAAFLEAAADGGQASVRFSDRAAAAAMDATFGSWIEACRLLSAGGTDERGKQVGGCTDEMLASYQRSFLRHYAAALNSDREVELYRAGLSELSMREQGAMWAARMPTIDQPVIWIGDGKAYAVRLRFDVARGCLTDMARVTLDGGLAAIQAVGALERNKLRWTEARKALPPAPDSEAATPEQVAQLKRQISELANNSRRQHET